MVRSLILQRGFSTQFVPKHEPVRESDVVLLRDFVQRCLGQDPSSTGLLVLTGAGLSTESGIPDYRSEDVGLYATSQRRPIQHKVFMESAKARQSYWARNFLGWPRWSSFQPNAGHFALSDWERRNIVNHIVTQNVDQLHYKSGSARVIELHGTNSIVKCMTCNFSMTRFYFQKILEERNADVLEASSVDTTIRPDGDMDIPQSLVEQFVVPPCPKCDEGILKPNVVFFGDNVPKDRVHKVQDLVRDSSGLLVIGSSLYVFSGYRIALHAKNLQKPIAILNIGPSRADSLADVRIFAKAGDILQRISFDSSL